LEKDRGERRKPPQHPGIRKLHPESLATFYLLGKESFEPRFFAKHMQDKQFLWKYFSFETKFELKTSI